METLRVSMLVPNDSVAAMREVTENGTAEDARQAATATFAYLTPLDAVNHHEYGIDFVTGLIAAVQITKLVDGAHVFVVLTDPGPKDPSYVKPLLEELVDLGHCVVIVPVVDRESSVDPAELLGYEVPEEDPVYVVAANKLHDPQAALKEVGAWVKATIDGWS